MQNHILSVLSISLFTNFFALTTCKAQAPQRFSYQSIIRNTSGQVMANQPVGIRLSILQGSDMGPAVYVETHSTTTNTSGLVSLKVGGGEVVSGNISGIDWAIGSYFIKTETDSEGGSNYSLSGTSQLLSVPYALFSEKTGNGQSGGSNSNTLIYTSDGF